jgi:membrane protein implicated in regulation of membrane protease activity
VEEAISGGRGKVRVGDTVWPAQGSDAAKGARVKITGNSGTVLIVEPVTA